LIEAPVKGLFSFLDYMHIARYLSPPPSLVEYLYVLENPPEMEIGGFFYACNPNPTPTSELDYIVVLGCLA